MFVPGETTTIVCESVAQGRPVLVIGTWGTGKSELLRSVRHTLESGCDSASTDLPRCFDGIDRSPQTAEAAAEELASGHPVIVTTTTLRGLPRDLYRQLLDRNATIVHLGALSVEQVATLLTADPGVGEANASVKRVHELSGGNGRIAEALVADIVGGDRSRDGSTTASSPPAVDGSSPASRIGLVAQALRSELPERAANFLDLLAVGEVVPTAIAEKLVGPDAIDDLAEAELLTRSFEGANLVMGLTAPALGSAISDALRQSERRALLTELLDMSARCDPPHPAPEHRLRRGRWAVRADDDRHGFTHDAIRAAMAIGEFEAIIDIGRWLLANDRTDTVAAHCLSTGYEALGRHADAVAVHDLLGGDEDLSWRMRRDTNAYIAHGGVADFDHDFNDDPLSEALAHRSWLSLFSGDVALADHDAAGVLGRPESSAQAVVWASMAQPIARITMGAGPSAVSVATRAERLLTHEGVNPFAGLQLGFAKAMALVRTGSAEEAYRIAKEHAANDSIPLLAAAWAGMAGLAARECGRYVEGATHLERTLGETFGDPYGSITLARSELDVCRALQGIPLSPDEDRSDPVGLFAPLVSRNRAWVHAAEQRIDTAQEFADEACRFAIANGHLLTAVLAAVDLARFGLAQRATELVRDFTQFDNPLLRVGVQTITALTTRQPEHLVKARAAALFVGWRVVADEIAFLLIGRDRKDHDPTSAACNELRFDPVRWPTPVCRSAPEPVLTQREQEVGRSAAKGRSSAEIATDLHISLRTVDNLLGRVYGKCGVHGRRDLIELAAETAPQSR